ncbi:MAG: hypothetical protein V7K48_34030 [Nostoc sp.]|uniref:hypothetical protein n=1 Tax=Nostoc sp. TaxID=1180 RepID=UPI002FFBD5D9
MAKTAVVCVGCKFINFPVRGIAKAKPHILEPIRPVEVERPSEFMGRVQGELSFNSSRKGEVVDDGCKVIDLTQDGLFYKLLAKLIKSTILSVSDGT